MGKRKFYESQSDQDTSTMTEPSHPSPDDVNKKSAPESALRQIVDMIQLPQSDFKDKVLLKHDTVPHNPTYHELEELDHTIVNVAYHVEQLLSKFQWMRDLDLTQIREDPTTDQLVRSLLGKFRIRLAALLIKQYWCGELPVLDSLLYVRHLANPQTLPQIQGDELTPSHMDELQALLLQAAVEVLKGVKQRINGDLAALERSENITHDLKKAVKKKKKNNTQKGTESLPDSPQSADWPPPLPEIGNDAIAKQVFTHKSTIVDANMASQADVIHSHNERLEFKGDSILDFIVCDMLFTMFPNDSEGALSIKKATLVCNDTLFDLSVTYKLHERLQTSKDLRVYIYGDSTDGLPDAVNKNKAIADVFEAYIAGVALDQGLLVVQKWLHKLYEPLVADMRIQKAPTEVNKNAKNELYRKVGSALQRVEYVPIDADETSAVHTVKCLIDGEEVARATDRTVKLAGLRAAMIALENPQLVEKFAIKRRELPRTAPITGHSID